MSAYDDLMETHHERKVLKEGTFWRDEAYREVTIYKSGRKYESGFVDGGTLKPRFWMIAVVLPLALACVSFVTFAVYTSNLGNRQRCEAYEEVTGIPSDYGFWQGCVKGFDDNDRLTIDANVDVDS